jgi:A/G-specific adenine glycosylase
VTHKNSPANSSFSHRILTWFEVHGRKDLPWQQVKSAYSVWVSEIMLQQTQVSTVIPYYLRFMQRFPDVASLAEAQQDEVMHHWTGLGYYARARNLHQAAKNIVHEHGGEFPNTLEEVMNLPGIGRSTAAAILSLAQGQHHSILDGNVKRVLGRFAAIEGWPGNKTVETQLWELADSLTPAARTAEYNQAMMDMGATLCTRSSPACSRCPVSADCQAFSLARPTDFPGKKPKKTIPVRSTFMLIPMWKNTTLIYKRPPTGIWGGLWGFYQIDSLDELEQQAKTLGLVDFRISFLLPFRHTFSHFHLDIQPVVLLLNTEPRAEVVREDQDRWYDLLNPPALGLAAPTQQLFTTLREEKLS